MEVWSMKATLMNQNLSCFRLNFQISQHSEPNVEPLKYANGQRLADVPSADFRPHPLCRGATANTR